VLIKGAHLKEIEDWEDELRLADAEAQVVGLLLALLAHTLQPKSEEVEEVL
jgi:hypothetical protein